MRNFAKFLAITAIMALIGLSMASCDFLFGETEDSKGSGGSGGGGGGGSGGGAGSSQDRAISISIGHSSSYTISSSGENWFKFVGTGNPVIFETTGNVVATTIAIFEGDNIWGYQYTSGGEGSNALRSESTTSGTIYFIRVTARNSTSGSYSLLVKEPTSNLRTNPITVSVGNLSSYTINSSGEHWFRFTGNGNRVFFESGGNVVTTNIRIFEGDNTSYLFSGTNGVNFITVSGRIYHIRITGNAGTYTFNLRYGTGDGSSQSNAIEVSNGYSSSHTITSSGEHWFIYQGTGNPVTFKTSGNVVATSIAVWINDDWLSSNNSSSGGDGSNALVSRSTTSGTNYFIRVTARSSTYGTYTFIVE